MMARFDDNDYEQNGRYSITVPNRKPRAKHLNEVLLSKNGGRMHSPKDRSRVREKEQLRRMSFVGDDE